MATPQSKIPIPVPVQPGGKKEESATAMALDGGGFWIPDEHVRDLWKKFKASGVYLYTSYCYLCSGGRRASVSDLQKFTGQSERQIERWIELAYEHRILNNWDIEGLRGATTRHGKSISIRNQRSDYDAD